MQTKRIELEGSHGSVAIERNRRGPEAMIKTIRIDSIIRESKRGEQTWKTWQVDSDIDRDALFQIATEIQERTDGCRGTNSMIHDYFNELERFVD